jgi:ribosomal protein L7/L12
LFLPGAANHEGVAASLLSDVGDGKRGGKSVSASDGRVDMVLMDPGVRPIPIYKMVDRFTRLDLKQARKLVDAPPQAIITQVPRPQAEALKIELEGCGATLELRPAGGPGAPTDLIQ